MTLHKNGKIGAYEYRFFVPPIIDSSSQVLEFLIEPDYDECVFFEIEQFYNSFIAVRKGGIWGFAEGPTPKTNDVLARETHVKWSLTTDDVEFGFNSLEELKEEVCRRYN